MGENRWGVESIIFKGSPEVEKAERGH